MSKVFVSSVNRARRLDGPVTASVGHPLIYLV